MCNAPACERVALARGLCRAHYDFARRYGATDKMLSVPCWCQACMTVATPDEVFAGLTRACGRKRCKPKCCGVSGPKRSRML